MGEGGSKKPKEGTKGEGGSGTSSINKRQTSQAGQGWVQRGAFGGILLAQQQGPNLAVDLIPDVGCGLKF